MTPPNFMILYVENALASAAFYERILGKAPLESAPTFVTFSLESGMMLGLWSETIKPTPEVMGGSCELAFVVHSKDAVQSLYEKWREDGVGIIQEPTQMVFGYTFTAIDPDSHRLRVFVETM